LSVFGSKRRSWNVAPLLGTEQASTTIYECMS